MILCLNEINFQPEHFFVGGNEQPLLADALVELSNLRVKRLQDDRYDVSLPLGLDDNRRDQNLDHYDNDAQVQDQGQYEEPLETLDGHTQVGEEEGEEDEGDGDDGHHVVEQLRRFQVDLGLLLPAILVSDEVVDAVDAGSNERDRIGVDSESFEPGQVDDEAQTVVLRLEDVTRPRVRWYLAVLHRDEPILDVSFDEKSLFVFHIIKLLTDTPGQPERICGLH